MTVPIYLVMNSVWVGLIGVAIGMTLEVFHYKKHFRLVHFYTKHFLEVKKYVIDDIHQQHEKDREKYHQNIKDMENELLFLHPRMDELIKRINHLEESNQQLIKIIEYHHHENQRLKSELDIIKKEHKESCDIWCEFMDKHSLSSEGNIVVSEPL